MTIALAGLAFTASVCLLTWIASLLRHDASLVDRVWPLCIAGAGAVYFALLPAAGPRTLPMLLLSCLWGLRLCGFITWRNWGHGEDRRYQEIRARNAPGFAWKSIYLVFALQALLAWCVSTSLLAGMQADAPLRWLDWVGAALALSGLVFEAIADFQLARFKADPQHQGQVMDRGLWRYSRHPNYFGECCVWWGLWLMAVSGAGFAGLWSLVSPLLMTFLLLQVSGVRLLEKDIAERRPQYRDYARRTPAFVPGPVRKNAP